MPIRFSTEAANADQMGTDTDTANTPQGSPATDEAVRVARDNKPLAGKPGRDINAAGFLKEDKDRGDPDAS